MDYNNKFLDNILSILHDNTEHRFYHNEIIIRNEELSCTIFVTTLDSHHIDPIRIN